MQKYRSVRDALELFSVQVGLSNEAATAVLRRSLGNASCRTELEEELLALRSDPCAPWMVLIANDAYEIDEVDSEDEARELVEELVWKCVFPLEEM